MDGELVKELTLAVQINKHEKAVKIVEEKLPHNSEAFQDNLYNQSSVREPCMLVAYLSYCLLITILFFMDGELVKELTLAVQINKHEKAVKIVEEKLPHNSEAFQDNLHNPSSVGELYMLVAYLSYCLLITILFFMDGELVKELTLAVQINKHEKAAKIVELIGKAAAQLRSFPVFFKRTINPPTTTRGRSVEDRLKAINEVN